jgi:hypothetical protein
MRISDQRSELHTLIRSAAISYPPAPWTHRSIHAISGLTDLGYLPHSDYLLVLSQQGRSIYNCRNGERICRDTTGSLDFDVYGLTAHAFGPFAGIKVRTAGLHGGGLALNHPAGWQLQAVTLDWPEQAVVLSLTHDWLQELLERETQQIYCLAKDQEIRTFGFSPTGYSMVVASADRLLIIAQPEC